MRGVPGHHIDLAASRAGTAMAYAAGFRGHQVPGTRYRSRGIACRHGLAYAAAVRCKSRTGALIATGSARESDRESELAEDSSLLIAVAIPRSVRL